MLLTEQIEELICVVSSMDRPVLVHHIRQMRAGFPIDFTNDFLESCGIDRLRHIFVALCIHCQQMPDLNLPHAA